MSEQEGLTPFNPLDYIKTPEDLEEYAKAYMEDNMPLIGCVQHDCAECKARQERPNVYVGQDDDGEFAVDLVAPNGIFSASVRTDGRVSWAYVWNGESKSGTDFANGAMTSEQYIAKVKANPERAAALERARERYAEARQEQEPVAWLWLKDGNPVNVFLSSADAKDDPWWRSIGFSAAPLYTAPQPEQPAVPSVPEGFVLVPVEPTEEMLKAMEKEWMCGSHVDMARREYAAMLAAAPQPEQKGDQQ